MEVDIISESRQESIAGDELQRGHKMTFQQGGGRRNLHDAKSHSSRMRSEHQVPAYGERYLESVGNSDLRTNKTNCY